MSYFETLPGMGRPSYSDGMGAVFPTREESPGMLALQQGLQRMNLLPAGAATGRWTIATAAALAKANKNLGRTAAPRTGFTTTNRGANVDVPDDLVAAILNTPSAPPAALPPGPDPAATPPPGMMLAEPATTTTSLLPPAIQEPSRTKLYVAAGLAVVAIGGVAAYALWPKKKSTPNRRRVRRNRRRRSRR
jgi:hypothetical protein